MTRTQEIYLASCAEIASAFESSGFRWRKSLRCIDQKDGDLTFRVAFQSDRLNGLVADPAGSDQENSSSSTQLFLSLEDELAEIERYGSVGFIPHVGVFADSIKKWRDTLVHPLRTGDQVAATNLGYVFSEAPTWLNINLANPRTRSGRIAAIIELIRTSGFRYFDRFRNPDEVVASLIHSSDPGMMDYSEIEYAVFYGSPQLGVKVLERYLSQWPEAVDPYEQALQEYRKDGIPISVHGQPGPRLARAALALGLVT